MDEQRIELLAGRVDRLETTVWELQRTVTELSESWNHLAAQARQAPAVPPATAQSPSSTQQPTTVSPEASSAPAHFPQPQFSASRPSLPQPPASGQRIDLLLFPEGFDTVRSGGWWLNKAGIILLLLGLAFLFKYAVDRGWLTEQVRIAFGLILGTLLLAVGLRVRMEHPHFSQVLLGGSIAAYYITGFAAFQLYRLVDYGVAFAFMVLVTLLAFFLSVSLNGVVLALIGTIGGLATPFLLHTDTSNIPALIGYICLLLAGTTAIFMVRGWYSLLWTSFLGAWIVFIVAPIFAGATSIYDKWALQGGAVFALVAFWLLPVTREVLWGGSPPWLLKHHEVRVVPEAESDMESGTIGLVLLTFLTFLLEWAFSMTIWGSLVSYEAWGWIVLASALVLALVAWSLRLRNLLLAHTHARIASGLLTLALVLLFHNNEDNNNTLYLSLAVEGVALLFISKRFLRESVSTAGHLVFLGVALWFIQRVSQGNDAHTAMLNTKGLVDLAVILTAFVGSLFAAPPKEYAWVYRGAVHASLLAWLWRELSILPDGRPYITIAWGIYALVLLVVGVSVGRNRALIDVAIATLFPVVAKLFLVDLAKAKCGVFCSFLALAGCSCLSATTCRGYSARLHMQQTHRPSKLSLDKFSRNAVSPCHGCD